MAGEVTADGVHLPVIYDLTQTIPSRIYAEDILNCPYSGAVKSIILPAGTYKLECWGAMGGYRSSVTTYAGKGGYSVGTLTLVDRKTNVFLYAGGKGNNSSASSGTVVAGGFNGGGCRYSYCGGGGGTDIRIGTDSLCARVIVAGGGGSDGATNKTGMYGGGETGGSATESYGSSGYGGTQTGNSGGASYIATVQSAYATSTSDVYSGFGFGGNGVYRSSGYGGAGGGGWYGGTGSYPDGSGDDDRGGGGGSGYVYTASTANNYPVGCLLNSTHYLIDASTIAGNASMPAPGGSTETGHADNGYIRITVLSIDKAVHGKCKVNGTWKSISEMRVNVNGTWKEVVAVKSKLNGVWKQ